MNMTSPDIVTLFTGATNLSSMGVISKINELPEMDIWGDDGDCNRIDGVDITLMPPVIDRESTIYIYNKEVCFRLPLVHKKDVSVIGIPAYKFQPRDNMLGNIRDNPDNACFYPHGPPYPFSGVLNISPCKFGKLKRLSVCLLSFLNRDMFTHGGQFGCSLNTLRTRYHSTLFRIRFRRTRDVRLG